MRLAWIFSLLVLGGGWVYWENFRSPNDRDQNNAQRTPPSVPSADPKTKLNLQHTPPINELPVQYEKKSPNSRTSSEVRRNHTPTDRAAPLSETVSFLKPPTYGGYTADAVAHIPVNQKNLLNHLAKNNIDHVYFLSGTGMQVLQRDPKAPRIPNKTGQDLFLSDIDGLEAVQKKREKDMDERVPAFSQLLPSPGFQALTSTKKQKKRPGFKVIFVKYGFQDDRITPITPRPEGVGAIGDQPDFCFQNCDHLEAQSKVFTLGHGGEIILEADDYIVDGPGADFIVYENAVSAQNDKALNKANFMEFGYVSVAEVNIPSAYRKFPCSLDKDLTGCLGVASHLGQGDPFDLGAVGIKVAKFIKIQDSGSSTDALIADPDTHPDDLKSRKNVSKNHAGIDIDAVTLIHMRSVDELRAL